MNETIRVTANGSCVTTIVKMRAGSNGARRAQSDDRRSARSVRGGGASTASRPRSRVVLMAAPRLPWVVRPPPAGHRAVSSRLPLPVALGDVLGQCLASFEGLVHAHPAGDGGTDVLRHLRAEVGELGDADE